MLSFIELSEYEMQRQLLTNGGSKWSRKKISSLEFLSYLTDVTEGSARSSPNTNIFRLLRTWERQPERDEKTVDCNKMIEKDQLTCSMSAAHARPFCAFASIQNCSNSAMSSAFCRNLLFHRYRLIANNVDWGITASAEHWPCFEARWRDEDNIDYFDIRHRLIDATHCSLLCCCCCSQRLCKVEWDP